MIRHAIFVLLAFALPTGVAVAAPLGAANVAVQIGDTAVEIDSAKGIGFGDGRIQPIDVRVVPPTGTRHFDWIAAAMRGTSSTKTVTFLRLGQTLGVEESIIAQGSSIVEVEFPGADANNDRREHLRVRVQPKGLATAPASGTSTLKSSPGIVPAFFRLEVDGLPATALQRVSKVAPFTVRTAGDGTPPVIVKVTVADDSFAEPWHAWARRELLEGQPATPRSARLAYFTEQPSHAKARPFLIVELEDLRLESFERSTWKRAGATQSTTFGLKVGRVRLAAPPKLKPGNKIKKWPK